MKTTTSELQELLILEPKIHEDKRGYFFESFNAKKLKEHIGRFNVLQINESKSRSGVLRGLHFQRPPYTQAKIVRVLSGAILDVVVDIRTDSPTYGDHRTFVLDDVYKEQLFIPRGFAHGFVVLSRSAKFQYLVDNEYSPAHECGIHYKDPVLNIDWEINRPKVNEKDKKLAEYRDQSFYSTLEYLANPLG